MLSPLGRCHAFDARADGYVRAEGAGAVILKRLEDAIADGDHIRAVIKGTGVNSDGHTMGLSLPSETAQSALLEAIYAQTGVEPDSLSFVEAHGTGTPAGDPIELTALGKTLGQRRALPLPIGSAKTNIGHLETASGMAGLIKAMLALEHRTLPASLHFETPNPHVAFDALGLEVATQPLALPQTGQLIAGVNSFGFGGTNAHAILASAPLPMPVPATQKSDPVTPTPPLLLSARSGAALTALAQDWSALLATKNTQETAALLRANARRRDHHRHRLYSEATGLEPLTAVLSDFAKGIPNLDIVSGLAGSRGRIAFVFAGNGAQFIGMARDALEHSAAFRAMLDQVDAQLSGMLGWSVAARLREDDPATLRNTEIAQPLLFAVQVGIVAALRAGGIEPDICLGHSVGEIAAAWAAGALSLETACRIVTVRSRQQHRTQGAGGMAALSLASEGIDDIADEIIDMGLEIAASNSRSSITVAGPQSALERLETEANDRGWRYTRLDLDYAFHSAVLEPVRPDLLLELDPIHSADCDERFISTVTGETFPGSQLSADYWWRNVREQVRFRQAVAHAIEQGAKIFIEIGPGPILQSYLRDGLRAAEIDGRVLTSLMRQPQDRDPFPTLVGQCYVAGYDLSAKTEFDGPANIANLPQYPWQRQRHWYTVTSEGVAMVSPQCDHPLLGFRYSAQSREWTQTLDMALQPWLADHAVEGVAILPAAAMLELALAALHADAPDATALGLSELEIRHALTLEEGQARTLRVRLDGERSVFIESRLRLGDESWTVHASARLAPETGIVAPREPGAIVRRRIDAATLYARAEALGLNYGPQFRTVSQVDILDDGSARAWLEPQGSFEDYLVAPPMLDGGLQAFLALLSDGTMDKPEYSLLPWRFTGVTVFAPFGRIPHQVRLNVSHRGVRSARGAMTFYDADGMAVAQIAECWFRQVRLTRAQTVAERAFHFHTVAMPLAVNDAAPDLDPARILGAMNDVVSTSDSGTLLEGYITSAAHQTLLQLVGADKTFAIDELIVQGLVCAEAEPLLVNLLDLLNRHGVAREEYGQWHLAADSSLPEPALIWRTVLAEDPALTAELALVAAAGDALPGFLANGRTAPLPTALLEQFYHASPVGRKIIGHLRTAVLALAQDWPSGKPLRILDIGGGLARPILDSLSGWPGDLRYVAADTDTAQAGRLAARLSDRPEITVIAWDLDSDASQLGGSFDLVLSAASLSRSSFVGSPLAALRGALAPGGVILAAEPAPNALWNWMFGQHNSWWRQGIAAEFPLAPLANAEDWHAQLLQAGFAGIVTRNIEGDTWPVVLLAARRPPASLSAIAAANGSVVVIVADAGDKICGTLAKKLTAAGSAVHIVRPPKIDDGKEYCDALTSLSEGDIDVVALPQSSSGTDRLAATNVRLMQVLNVARLTAATRQRARIWVVTRNAQQTGAAGTPEDAAVWGLGRTIANEMPQLECRLVDLSSKLAPDEAGGQLADALVSPDDEREILLTAEGRRVMRLRRGVARATSAQGPVALTAKMPGRLDSLTWQPQALRSPGPGEVAISVKTADVNFRDVMWALDLLPEEALLDGYAGPALGLACAGIVRAVGPGVGRLKPGDPVLATASATFASEVIAREHTVTKLPPGLDFAMAATLPVAFVTVLYALGHLANLQPGETVLIHGGAGGVGLAAIQYARYKGATVIATAGSPAKRAFLRQLGVDHVLDSRDLKFGDAIRELTGGQGVDVVLNSLSGDAMELSLALVKPFGRFLELGKRDFFTGTRITLKPLRRNVSYFAVDVDALPLERPDLSRTIMAEIVALIEKGALRPLPYRLFARSEVSEAFRLMQTAGHIGKIILSMEDAEALPQPAFLPLQFSVRGDGTYLISGGLSGFGLATAQWLAARGARSIALLGRRGAQTPGAKQALEAFATAGIDARAFNCDVADEDSLAETLAIIRSDMQPLRGIVHAAMVLDDGLLDSLDSARNAKVLTPKLGGAVHLDNLTRADPIELFLLYSSATTALGAPGQGSYVCANFALEGLARERRAAGLPAFVVGWGPIADAGYLARNPETREMLARRLAANPITAAEALDALPELMAGGETCVTFASVRWEAAQRMLPILSTPTFAAVSGAHQDTAEGNLRERLTTLPPDECRDLLLTVLTEEVGRILSTAPESLDPNRPVSELGMDSLMAVEMRLALEARIGVNLPMFSLAPHTSLNMIAARIARDLSAPEAVNDVAAVAERYEVEPIKNAVLPDPANPQTLEAAGLAAQ